MLRKRLPIIIWSFRVFRKNNRSLSWSAAFDQCNASLSSRIFLSVSLHVRKRERQRFRMCVSNTVGACTNTQAKTDSLSVPQPSSFTTPCIDSLCRGRTCSLTKWAIDCSRDMRLGGSFVAVRQLVTRSVSSRQVPSISHFILHAHGDRRKLFVPRIHRRLRQVVFLSSLRCENFVVLLHGIIDCSEHDSNNEES